MCIQSVYILVLNLNHTCLRVFCVYPHYKSASKFECSVPLLLHVMQWMPLLSRKSSKLTKPRSVKYSTSLKGGELFSLVFLYLVIFNALTFPVSPSFSLPFPISSHWLSMILLAPQIAITRRWTKTEFSVTNWGLF